MVGRIFNIQRFCVHDGPGIRTVMFFKGCPLHCKWCCNPESQQWQKQLMYNATKCIHCGRCEANCETGAIRFEDKVVKIDRASCTYCGKCSDNCPADALNLSGRDLTVYEAMELLLKDKHYFDTSGGGVTFSGGEASMQAEFIVELSKLLKAERVNLALETCGQCSEQEFSKLAKLMDTILFDVKLLDKDLFREYTGGDLDRVLANLEFAASCSNVWIRVPLIPGVNMNDKFYSELGALAERLPIRGIDLLPFHRLGENKYRQLDIDVWHCDLAASEENQKALETVSKYTAKHVRIP